MRERNFRQDAHRRRAVARVFARCACVADDRHSNSNSPSKRRSERCSGLVRGSVRHYIDMQKRWVGTGVSAMSDHIDDFGANEDAGAAGDDEIRRADQRRSHGRPVSRDGHPLFCWAGCAERDPGSDG